MWSSKIVKENTKTIFHPIQKTQWTGAQSTEEKMELLHIDLEGSISVDIAAGKKLNARGSFQYLEEEKVKANNM